MLGGLTDTRRPVASSSATSFPAISGSPQSQEEKNQLTDFYAKGSTIISSEASSTPSKKAAIAVGLAAGVAVASTAASSLGIRV